MIRRVSEECSGQCGAVVTGEVDTESHEFIHRFRLPASMETLQRAPTRTEVEGIRLVTFAPDSDWYVECPLCRRQIPISAAE
jgi:hypothetical protein